MWTTQAEFVMITEIVISRIKSTVFPGIIKNVGLFHCRIRTKIQSGNGHNVFFFATSHLILSKVRSGTLHYYTNELINRGEKKNLPHSNYYYNHNVGWRTSDSLSLDDPRLPKLWLEHSLFVNPCGKKKQNRKVFFSLTAQDTASKTNPWYWSALTHFGSSARAAGAAPRAAADSTHKARFQQLLPPGVQTVQLLHGTYTD